MTDQEQRIQELILENQSLQEENLRIKLNEQRDNDQRDIAGAAGELLRLGEIRYRTVFENSLLGNKIISPELKILQVNQALVNMLGFTAKQELIGRTIIDFAHPDFVNDWQILQQKLWNKRLRSFSLETCLVANSGAGIWVSVNSTLFHDSGEYLGFTTIEDISERKSNLDGLRIREEKFRNMTNIMPQQVWTASPIGRLNFVNQQVCDYLGRTFQDLVQNGWDSYIHPEDAEKCRSLWETSVATGSEYTVEFRLKNKHGQYNWYLARATALLDDDGEKSLWMGTNTDIQLQKTNEQRKDEFLSIVSHELKTPLTSIKLYNQLAQQAKSPEKQKEFVDKSSAHIARLELLIRDLLDVSRINAGKVVYNLEPFPFDELLSETVESQQVINDEVSLVVQTNEPATIRGDRHRLEQVVNNLLTNAIKYSPGSDKVIINSRVSNGAVIVSVQDFGIGIHEKDLSRLFDRYYRVDNSRARFDGLGLGLYISAEILKRHNGSLWIEGEPGTGSTFYFLLPLNGRQEFIDIATDGQTFYKGNFISVRFNQEKGWLEADWLGYQNLESVKKGCMIILDLFKLNKCSKVLNDNSQVMGNWSEAAD